MKDRDKTWFIGLAILIGFVGFDGAAFAAPKPRLVTTTTVLADLAREVAGDDFSIYAVASPKRDIHKVVPTPKDVLKTKKADVFIHHGASAEPWLQPLLNAAGNKKFLGDSERIIDASVGIKLLEVPTSVSRLEGDIHPHGNPHYWLDPAQGKLMADNITKKLSSIYPNRAATFEERNQKFQKKLEAKLLDWQKRMKLFEGTTMVTYHRSWSYFVKAYGLNVIGEIEPKPGIPVTSKHLSHLQSLMKQKNTRLIVTEPYQDDKPAERLAKQGDANVVELLQFTGAKKDVRSYIDLMEYNIRQIENALREVSHG